jgi:hypothetical protein
MSNDDDEKYKVIRDPLPSGSAGDQIQAIKNLQAIFDKLDIPAKCSFERNNQGVRHMKITYKNQSVAVYGELHTKGDV